VHLDDTIVAISTPPGRGGIGVVRLAGDQARAIAEPLLCLRHPLEPNRAHFGELIDAANGERIDEVVATFFAKPHSYTTDDIVEISAHGSPVVLKRIVEMALVRGARLAEPGEFTMRAFLNGRLDLTQAEAVRDLIESRTLYQAKVAAQQLEGALSKRLTPIKKDLVDLIAVLEAGIDFAEDDVAVLPSQKIIERIARVREPLQSLAASFAYGKLVHEGLTLAIIGRPNVGKSSLFNRLVERERAIVTATPGTTRDLVSETVAIAGIPIRLIDTAGIRTSADEVESIGIQKSFEAVADADLVLLVTDFFYAGDHDVHADRSLIEKTAERNRIFIINKIDLHSGNGIERRRHEMPKEITVETSATTGQGIEQLRSAIIEAVGGKNGGEQEGGFLTNVRHQALVKDSLSGLDAAEAAVRDNIPHEMLLMDLYNALRPLDAITGETTADDILNLIFSSFCIGK
jgi:tRNA modification GTPase